jgi:hypothetical protein
MDTGLSIPSMVIPNWDWCSGGAVLLFHRVGPYSVLRARSGSGQKLPRPVKLLNAGSELKPVWLSEGKDWVRMAKSSVDR